MKPLFVSMLLAGLTTFWLSTSHAGPHDPGVNARQHHQQQRIGQGLRTGDLTRGEARKLEQEQRQIRREERRYLSDGQLTPRERADLQQDLNSAGRHIYNERHDAERRY